MSLEIAANAFEDLAARHRDNAHANRRILLIAAAAAFATVFVILVAVDSTRTSPARRYAGSVLWQHHASLRCDDALGRRRFWFGPVIASFDFCYTHDANASATEVTAFPQSNFTFLAVGDWGRDGMCCQRDVAAEMALAAVKVSPSFIVSTGDNFYDNGIERSTDSQIDRSWRGVYIDPYKSMKSIPWKLILGNHDHMGNPAAQTVLHKKEPLWHMPKNYYFETSADGKVFMAFLDTTVMYYNQNQLAQFRGTAKSLYYRDNQVAALKKNLAETKAKWKLVFGHHPLFSSGENAVTESQNLKQMRTILLNILRDNGVAAYICGHEHTLEHLQKDGVHFFISGGGSKLSTIEASQEESLFALDRQGFMTFSLLNEPEELHVQVVDLGGKVVHRAKVIRPAD